MSENHRLPAATTQLAEYAAAQAEAGTQQEIQCAVMLAKRFPRDEADGFGRVIRACKRYSLASEATYNFKRRGQNISGPSAPFARELARIWGNIWHGFDIVADDDRSRTIRAWAWDLESNARVRQDDSFLKVVYRKDSGWIEADERELRELTNRRAAICVRNCILQLLPRDLVEDALAECDRTLQSQIRSDPDSAKKAIVVAFGSIGVTAARLAENLGHPIDECSPSEIADLRKIYQAIRDGQATWSDYCNPKDREEKAHIRSVDDLKAKMAAESGEPRKRHSKPAESSVSAAQKDEIRRLAEEKKISKDQMSSILLEYGTDNLELIGSAAADEVISILREAKATE